MSHYFVFDSLPVIVMGFFEDSSVVLERTMPCARAYSAGANVQILSYSGFFWVAHTKTPNVAHDIVFSVDPRHPGVHMFL